MRVYALLLAFAAFAALAQARKEQARIDALIAAIETSGCEMERNGSLHGGKAAAAHLRMKLENAGDRVQTASEFIDHVASGSSASGAPYRVVCPGQAPRPSGQWLREKLAR